MVRPTVRVFTNPATKLTLSHDGEPLRKRIRLRTVQVPVERRQAGGELLHQIGKLPLRLVALSLVRIPSTQIDGSDSKSHVQLDDLRDHLEVIAESGVGVFDAA